MSRSRILSAELNTLDENGVYHEDYESVIREEIMWEYGRYSNAYVNLILDDKFDRLKELYMETDNPYSKLPKDIAGLMAEYGRLDMLKWVEDKTNFPSYILDVCMYSGNVEMAKWLYDKGHRFTLDNVGGSAYGCAACSGKVEMLDWLYEIGHLVQTESAIDWSTEPTGLFSAMSCAAMSGNPYTIQWLLDYKAPWDSYAFTSAACHGHLDVIQYLAQLKCPWDNGLLGQAEMKNYQHIIKWIHDNKYYFPDTSDEYMHGRTHVGPYNPDSVPN